MCTWTVYFTPVLCDCFRATSYFSSFHKSKKNHVFPSIKKNKLNKHTDKQQQQQQQQQQQPYINNNELVFTNYFMSKNCAKKNIVPKCNMEMYKTAL